MYFLLSLFGLLFILAGIITAFVLLIQKNLYLTKLNKKYSPIIDVEKEALRIKREVEQEAKTTKQAALNEAMSIKNSAIEKRVQIENEKKEALSRLEEIASKILELESKRNKLNQEISLLEEKDFLYSYGLYEPHYNFEKLVDYERRLCKIREDQKKAISGKNAVEFLGKTETQLEQRSINNIKKLALRAFNAECDYFVTKVNYKNVVTFEQRIKKLWEQLNGFTSLIAIRISDKYMNLKIDELRIIHEFEEKKEEDAERQRQIKEIMRDELKAEKEIELAQKEAEKEERIYENALNKAIAEAQAATGHKQAVLQQKIALLQTQLEEAHQKKERAISRAQQTKSGHVYVISNIGSFGEDVYKIGMTRRLEPLERVKELSSASVPFEFDVHAVIYSENAPELENNLHKACDSYRVNRVNSRKEFFKVSIDKIEEFAKHHDADIFFTKIPEAKEFRTSLALGEKIDSTQ